VIQEGSNAWRITWEDLPTPDDFNDLTVTVALVPPASTLTVDDAWTGNGSSNWTARKTSFRPGECIGYNGVVNNRTTSTLNAEFVWNVTGPAGQLLREQHSLNADVGSLPWVLGRQIPRNAAAGTYTYTLSVTHNNQTSSRSATFTVQGPPVTNLALCQQTYTSSVEGGQEWDLGGWNAVDGNLNTRWASRKPAEGGQLAEWILVDLGTLRTVNNVVLRWHAAYSTIYEIFVHDGVTWEPIDLNLAGQGAVESRSFAPRQARFVLLFMVGKSDPSLGYSLSELEVYGPGLAAGADVTNMTSQQRGRPVSPSTLPSAPGAGDQVEPVRRQSAPGGAGQSPPHLPSAEELIRSLNAPDCSPSPGMEGVRPQLPCTPGSRTPGSQGTAGPRGGVYDPGPR
jgi:hypothetical protein